MSFVCRNKGENAEKIRSRIIDDLREQAYTNSKLEEELLEWVNEQDSSVQINTDVAIDIFAKQIFSYSRDQLNNSIDVPSGRYQRIYELLQNKQWVEADVETARLIFKLRNKDFDARNSYGITKLNRYKLEPRDIEELHIDDLKRINSLWVNASNGRFGFSVQRQLWEKSHQDINNELENFGNTVGWRGVDGWIYYSDLSNLSSDRKGTFPAIVVMSRATNRPLCCKPNISLFKVFMKRAYTL